MSKQTTPSNSQIALSNSLKAIGFKNVGFTNTGCLFSEDRPGITPKFLRNQIFQATDVNVWVDCVKRNHGRIRYDGIHMLSLDGPNTTQPKVITGIERAKALKNLRVQPTDTTLFAKLAGLFSRWVKTYA